MKNTWIVAAFLLSTAVAAYGQSSLTGKWHGTENNLPFIDLTIIEASAGQASGSAVFYLIKRNPDGSNPHVDGQGSGPLENSHYEPEKLTFDMHRPDGSVVSFRVELTDANHARLFRTSDNSAPGAGFPLVRQKP